MESQLSDVLATTPALEQICQSLTFPELTQLWIANNRQDIPCNVEVEDADGQKYILNGVNAKTIATYPFILENSTHSTNALIQAVIDDNFLAVTGLFELGFSLDQKYDQPFDYPITPLQAAAYMGNVQLLKILIDYGGNFGPTKDDPEPNIDFNSMSPIWFAIQGNSVETVKFLLELGVSPNLLDPTDNYSLFSVVAKKNQYIVDPDAHSGDPLSWIANSIEIIKLLLLFGGNPNYAQIITKDGKPTIVRGYPILSAIYSPETSKILEFLLSIGCDPNLGEDNGFGFIDYPISAAVKTGNSKFVKILLEANADPNIPKEDIPLMIATENGYIDMVDELLKHKADPNALELNALGSMNSPLSLTINRGAMTRNIESKVIIYWVIANLLLEAGADPNYQNNFRPSFHIALEIAPPSLIRKMIQKGANPNYRFGNEVPLSIVTRLKNSELVLELLKHGANPNISSTSVSILSSWIKIDNLIVVRAILDAGGDPNDSTNVDDLHNLPIFVAIDNDNLDAVKLLVEKGVDLTKTGFLEITLSEKLSRDRRPLIERYLKAQPSFPKQ